MLVILPSKHLQMVRRILGLKDSSQELEILK